MRNAQLLAILLAVSGGCPREHSDYAVTISVLDGWTREPIPNAEVVVEAPYLTDGQGAPRRIVAKTDNNGAVMLSIPADWASRSGVRVYAGGKSCHASVHDLCEGVTRMAAPWDAATGLVLVRVAPAGKSTADKNKERDECDSLDRERWITLTSQRKEKELAGVKVEEPDLSPKLGRWLARDAQIEGQWASCYWHDGVHLTIKKGADGRYDVVYYARGDLSSWTLRRRATFTEGVLEFDAPVEEYAPYPPYRRFYLLRIADLPRFASQPVVERWLKEGAPAEGILTGEIMLVRMKPKQTPASRPS